MAEYRFEEVALFIPTNKKKDKDGWPLEIDYCIDLNSNPKLRRVRVYYSGVGQHPYGGTLPDEDIVHKTFTDKQESYDFLEEMINKYGAKELKTAYEKIYDHWSGTKVILNCKATWEYITTTLFDKCGLYYSDDFKGDRNYRGSKPEPTPLYINKSPGAFVNLIEVNGETRINYLNTRKWNFVKKGETKSRIDFHFMDFNNSRLVTTAGYFADQFKEMVKYNYCFGETITELVNIAYNLVKDDFITQNEFDTLFANAKLVDPVEIVKKSVTLAKEQFGFNDEMDEEKFDKALRKFETIGIIDPTEDPKVAALAK